MKKTEIKILKIIIICTAFLYGGFYDFTACFLTVSLGICLLWLEKREKGLLLYWNSALLLAIVIVAGYLISVICAVDRGMAFTGVLKFLPLILFTLALMQFTKEEREGILMAVPLAGTAITALSLLAYIVPGVKEHFYMADRLGGTFQYSNTMALYLLVGIVLVESRYKYTWKAAALIAVQLLGIMLTGSRSVFVLMALVLIYYAWKNKAFRCINLFALAAAVLAGAVYGLVSGNFQNIGRFLTVSFESSTFIGRLLYWQDALPLVLRNPFGLGYMGYYYSQGEIQTGVYSVVYAHNDLLQILLDIGWIPAIVVVAVTVKTLISSQTDRDYKVILILLALHSLFDFNMQFLSVCCIFFAVVMQGEGRKETTKKQRSKNCIYVRVCIACVTAVSMYFVIPFTAFYANQWELARKLYPAYTEAELMLLERASSREEGEELADSILKRNK